MRVSIWLACAILLSGCSGAQDGATNETSLAAPEDSVDASEAGGEAPELAADESSASSSDAEAASNDDDASDEAMVLRSSAWRVTGEDGAIYTTFFDADGLYRDMKNGEAWADGAWERLGDGRVCFSPSDEGRAGACWSLGRESREGTMRVTSDDGREVELQRVTYIAPIDEPTD